MFKTCQRRWNNSKNLEGKSFDSDLTQKYVNDFLTNVSRCSKMFADASPDLICLYVNLHEMC